MHVLHFLAAPQDALGVCLGIAAVVLVAGWALTRWQRDRMRFALIKTALERGVTRFPGTPPYWLVSLRQGVTLMALGIGLGVVGLGAWWMARGVAMPIYATAQVSTAGLQATQPTAANEPGTVSHGMPPREGHAFDRDHPSSPPPGEDENGSGPGGPHFWDGRGEDRGGDRRPPRSGLQHDDHDHGPDRQGPNPPPRDPEMDKWHRAEVQQTLGLVAVGTGFILLLVGAVRMVFAKVEQRYAADSDEATVY